MISYAKTIIENVELKSVNPKQCIEPMEDGLSIYCDLLASTENIKYRYAPLFHLQKFQLLER